ncbi:unnamed protein product, partial [Rotaria socialis]
NIPANANWAQNGVTIGGGNGYGGASNQLNLPQGLFVDDGIDSEVIDLVSQLSADACSHSLISTPSRHFAIRTVATDHY